MAQEDTSAAVTGQRHAAEHADVERRHVGDHVQVSQRHLAAHEELYARHGSDHTLLILSRCGASASEISRSGARSEAFSRLTACIHFPSV